MVSLCLHLQLQLAALSRRTVRSEEMQLDLQAALSSHYTPLRAVYYSCHACLLFPDLLIN